MVTTGFVNGTRARVCVCVCVCSTAHADPFLCSIPVPTRISDYFHGRHVSAILELPTLARTTSTAQPRNLVLRRVPYCGVACVRRFGSWAGVWVPSTSRCPQGKQLTSAAWEQRERIYVGRHDPSSSCLCWRLCVAQAAQATLLVRTTAHSLAWFFAPCSFPR
jgi:hypothetical protein